MIVFWSFLAGLTVLSRTHATVPPLITPAPQLFRRAFTPEPGQTASECAAFYSIAESCTSATPNFLYLSPETQVQCVCYSSSTFVPSIFDGALDTCLAYLKTASPDVYSAEGFGIYTGKFAQPCQEYSSALSVASATADQRVSACASVYSIRQSCEAATSDFTDLPLSSQASCQCYVGGSSSYAPNVFDGYISNCLDYYSANDPSYYTSTLHGDDTPRNPCASAGNVRNAPTATGSEATAQSFSRGVASNTGSSAVLTTTEPQATAMPNGASRYHDQFRLLLVKIAVVGLGQIC